MATEYPDDYPSLVPDLRAALSRAEQERDELAERLRREQRASDAESEELTRQMHQARQERDEAREALKPFVRAYEATGFTYMPDTGLTLADFERARATLSGGTGDRGTPMCGDM